MTKAGSDYWFVYENTLFIDINSNNRSTAEHKAFIEEAIAANPNVKWKTVVFHHSIYSTASHVNDSDIITRREELPQVFTDLDIDVVLMGHDHVYTRTYMMNGYTPDTEQGEKSSVTNPTGILYLTANSASGSKYYDIKAPNAEYSAKMDQSYRRTVTDIDVTDTSYTMTTYYADTMEVLDQFTINKTDSSALQELVSGTEAKNLKEADYTAESWDVFQSAYENAKAVLANADATQAEIDAARETLENALAGLKTPAKEDGKENPGNNNGNNSGSNGDVNGGNANAGTNNDGQTADPGTKKPGTPKKENVNDTSVKKTGKTATVKTGDATDVAAAGLMMLAAGSVVVVYATRKREN